MLLGEVFLEFLSGFHQSAHINFVEGGEHSSGVLGFLESLGDDLSHLAHTFL